MTTGEPARAPWRWAWIALAVAALGLVVWLLHRDGRGRETVRADERPDAGAFSQPPTALARADAITRADFVGADACAACHRAEYDVWRASTHGRAGGAPHEVKVLAPFNGPPIRFRDAVVIPRAEGGVYSFVVRREGRPERVLSIDGVVGGGHMEGGGTQGFVSRFPDGTMRFLPFDFIRAERVWFCNSAGDPGGWVPIHADMPLAECADWPPNRVLGDTPTTQNCQSCHGSQIELRHDAASAAFKTELTSLHINCESCHGPGRRHIERVGDPKAVASGDLGMRSLTTLSKDGSLGVCWSCHALKVSLRPGYLSGKRLDAYYSVLMPDLREPAHAADGRNLVFAYQEGHLWSDCYVSGSMTCTSCHDPHSQRYRDAFGAPLQGRFDDRQCTSCHPSKIDRVAEHTHHKPGSAGARCVGCHMPFLQQPTLGDALRFARSDHVIPIPRPGFDAQVGVVSACRTCHVRRSEETLDAQVRAWYGEVKPHPRAIVSALRVDEERDIAAAARLVLRADERHAAALLVGLGAFARRFLSVDMPALDREVVVRLQALASHPQIDVRSLALASLHLSRGASPDVRGFLEGRLRAEGDDAPLVRSRWTTALGFFADLADERGDRSGVIAAHKKALEIDPQSARLLLQLGRAYAEVGLLTDAVLTYERSLALEPQQPGALRHLGIALARQNQRARAIATLERATALYRHDAQAQLDLGELYLDDRQVDKAIERLLAAAEVNPRLSSAQFRLAEIFAGRGEDARALRALELGLEFDPNDEDALDLQARLRSGRAKTPKE